MTHSDIRLPKAPTGIRGFDEITDGGLPRGRPTLVCGAAGCGKTLFSMEFLVRGATAHGEPGVFIAFEENTGELIQNVASLGFDVPDLIDRRLLAVDHVQIERNEIEEGKRREIERKRLAIEAQIAALRASFEADEEEMQRLLSEQELHDVTLAKERDDMARIRLADSAKSDGAQGHATDKGGP